MAWSEKNNLIKLNIKWNWNWKWRKGKMKHIAQQHNRNMKLCNPIRDRKKYIRSSFCLDAIDAMLLLVFLLLSLDGIREKRRRNQIQYAAYDEFDSRLLLLTYFFPFFVFYHSVIYSFAFSFHSIQFNSIPFNFIGNTIYGNILNWYNFGFCLFAKYFVNPIKRFISSPSCHHPHHHRLKKWVVTDTEKHKHIYMNYVPFVDAVDCHKWNVNWNLFWLRSGLAWPDSHLAWTQTKEIKSSHAHSWEKWYEKWWALSFISIWALFIIHQIGMNWNEISVWLCNNISICRWYIWWWSLCGLIRFRVMKWFILSAAGIQLTVCWARAVSGPSISDSTLTFYENS